MSLVLVSSDESQQLNLRLLHLLLSMDDPTLSYAELHEEWKAINLLLTLTSAVRNYGQPSLVFPDSSGEEDGSGNTKYTNILLQAMTTLLSRNNGVVAAIGTTASATHEPGNPGLANSPASCQWPALHEVEWKEGVPNQATGPLHIIAVPNPERRKKLKPEDRPGDCLVTFGRSHFATIEFHKWDSLFTIPQNDPLQNHVSTLNEYLTQYPLLPASDRWNHFINFTRYIVTRTFKKSHRRIFHWSSLSFIRHLTRVKAKDEVEAAFAKRSQLITSSRQHDILLGSLLLGMRDEGQIQTLIMDQCRYPEFCSELPNLLAAFEEVVVKKEAQTLEVKKGLGVYSEATCFEFHQLLVAALSAYANTLGAFRDAQQELSLQKNASVKRDESVGRTEDKGEGRMKDGTRKVEIQNDGPGAQGATMKKGKGKMAGDQSKKQGGHRDVQKPTVAGTDHVGPKPKLVPSSKEKSPRIQELTKVRNERAQQLWECSFLLWRISYSQILRDHLNLLDAAELLHMPGMAKLPLHPSEVRLYPGLNKSDVSECRSGSRDRADDEGDQVESQGEDEEFWTMGASVNASLAQVFERWMHLQVDHWATLQTVSPTRPPTTAHHSAATRIQNVHISLLSVDHPQQYNAKMEHWETTVRKLAVETPTGPHQLLTNANRSMVPRRTGGCSSLFNAQAIIDFFKMKIDEYAKLEQSDAIFHAFKPKPDAPNTYEPYFYGNVHCEAVLASLSEYIGCVKASKNGDSGDAKRLKEFIGNANKSVVAVSRLCCLVCWNLLDILRGGTQHFEVRGKHCIVSPVQLPPWLPRDVVVQMVARLKSLLLREIMFMVAEGPLH